MLLLYTVRNLTSRWIPIVVFLVLVSCRTTEEPEIDRTPPGAPVVSLLRATSPDASGTVVVSGAVGAVEAGVIVQVRESSVTSPASGQATAAANGSFTASITTQRLQLLEVVGASVRDRGGRPGLQIRLRMARRQRRCHALHELRDLHEPFAG